MADEPQSTQTEPMGNAPEVRNPDGTIKDTQTESVSSETKTLATSATEQKPATAPATKDQSPATTGAPEKYSDFKAPDGFDLDAKAIAAATPIFKELNLSQESAQRLVDFYAEQSKQAAEAPIKFYEETRANWRNDITKSDLGNGTDDLSHETKQNISAAIDSLPADLRQPFKDAMNLTGAGDNPAFVRALNAFGKAHREGTAVKGNGPAPTGQTAPGARPRSAAQALFPNLPSAS